MKTVSTPLASATVTTLSAVGLSLARARSHEPDPMTATYTLSATETLPTDHTPPPRFLSAPPSTRLSGFRENGLARAATASNIHEGRSQSPATSIGVGTARSFQRDDESLSNIGTPTLRRRSWLRRLSSNMPPSRDSSRTPPSRPGSAAISHSGRSWATSRVGSTAAMLPEPVSSPLPPNKLVKRTPSFRSVNGLPSSSPGSRIPLPVFRRPATSHQRASTPLETLSSAYHDSTLPQSAGSANGINDQWQQYFTPKVPRKGPSSARPHSSSGIPNPIKRIYPDRKYTPVLVSTRALVRPIQTGFDDASSVEEESEMAVSGLNMPPSVASSPLPAQPVAHSVDMSRRSFSIGDLLSTGPQPLWKRPSGKKSRAAPTRLNRKSRQRVASAPPSSMGNTVSTLSSQDSVRPAKRREVSSPSVAHGELTNAGGVQPVYPGGDEVDLYLSRSSPQLLDFSIFSDTSNGGQRVESTNSVPSTYGVTSASPETSTVRHARASIAHSEATSTVDSDSEFRSAGGSSVDNQGEQAFDSYTTRTTRSSSGKRGPPIDTLFDESPPTFANGRSTNLRDFLNESRLPGSERSDRYRHSTIEEEGSIISTPVRSLRDNSVTSTPSAHPGAQHIFRSSPPVMPDPDDINWDAPDDSPARTSSLRLLQTPNGALAPGSAAQHRFETLAKAGDYTTQSTPSRYVPGGEKATLWDWADPQPSPSHNDRSPPRPRTVHGKKDDTRGSRVSGRRAPSGMHARSISVPPEVPDTDGRRSVVANKFGTWGVGTKAVTENWNEDFDFDLPITSGPSHGESFENKRIDSGHEVLVPRSIREQQHVVVAHIGLLREWGLLIEELKELRVRAVALGMLEGPHAQAWQEVDAMIELADQETEEITLQPRRSPPSSPGFDYKAFEDDGPGSVWTEDSITLPEPLHGDDTAQTVAPVVSPHQTRSAAFQATHARPRKDSEAVARAVIEALQSKRSVSDPTALKPVSPSKKVPFDTATLRHIVPYVNGLKRRVKEAVREKEGLQSSPRRRSPPESFSETGAENDDDDDDDDPPFRSIFTGRGDTSPSALRRSRRDEMATDYDGFEFDISHAANHLEGLKLGNS